MTHWLRSVAPANPQPKQTHIQKDWDGRFDAVCPCGNWDAKWQHVDNPVGPLARTSSIRILCDQCPEPVEPTAPETPEPPDQGDAP